MAEAVGGGSLLFAKIDSALSMRIVVLGSSDKGWYGTHAAPMIMREMTALGQQRSGWPF